jgi:Cu/Ag efflux protein CusF
MFKTPFLTAACIVLFLSHNSATSIAGSNHEARNSKLTTVGIQQETTMRKSLIIAASLSSMLVSSAAFTASLTDNGVIKSIDTKGNSLTLVDGMTFTLPAKFDAKTIKVGEKIAVTYDVVNKKMIASAIKAG